MTNPTPPTTGSRRRLFLVSILALFCAGVANALRAAVASQLQGDIFSKIDPAHSAQLVGSALGASFAGWSLAVFLASPFLDNIGMRRALLGAMATMILGTALVIFAGPLGGIQGAGDLVWAGMGMQGLAWGLIEATINPLIGALYPDDRTRRLNLLHAWWPAGLVTGGLAGFALGAAGIHWQLLFGLIVVPAIAFGLLTVTSVFPQTERAAAGISLGDMFRELTKSPGVFLWLAIMMMTSASELAPGQWIDLALSHSVGMRGVLLLVYVSVLAFAFRHFAGPLERRFSNVGLLCLSAILAAIGLYGLSIAHAPVPALIAATAWGIGVCFMWPTMLAIVSGRYPRGGSLFIGLVGAAGAASNYLILPRLGEVYDRARLQAAGGLDAFNHLDAASLQAASAQAASASFQVVAILPALLIVIFGAIWGWETLSRGNQDDRDVRLAADDGK